MLFNGFVLMPSIFDRSRADALRVDYYTTCQESMLLHIERSIYHVDGYHDMFKAESVATLKRVMGSTLRISDMYYLFT